MSLLPLALTVQHPSKKLLLWPLIMAVSLLEFEMIVPSSLHSWFGHARGCLYLLSLLGPENCVNSPFFEVFWHLRFIMVSSFSTSLGQLTAAYIADIYYDGHP